MNNTTITVGSATFLFDEMRHTLTDTEGNTVPADVCRLSEGEFSVILNGISYHLFITRNQHISHATLHNAVIKIERETLRDKLAKQLQQESGVVSRSVIVKAPMPGLVTKVLLTEGSPVKSGEGILVMEAMKMENEIKSPKAGLLKNIFVKEKQAIEKNDNLFTIE